jgi:hypothetical protein
MQPNFLTTSPFFRYAGYALVLVGFWSFLVWSTLAARPQCALGHLNTRSAQGPRFLKRRLQGTRVASSWRSAGRAHEIKVRPLPRAFRRVRHAVSHVSCAHSLPHASSHVQALGLLLPGAVAFLFTISSDGVDAGEVLDSSARGSSRADGLGHVQRWQRKHGAPESSVLSSRAANDMAEPSSVGDSVGLNSRAADGMAMSDVGTIIIGSTVVSSMIGAGSKRDDSCPYPARSASAATACRAAAAQVYGARQQRPRQQRNRRYGHGQLRQRERDAREQLAWQRRSRGSPPDLARQLRGRRLTSGLTRLVTPPCNLVLVTRCL